MMARRNNAPLHECYVTTHFWWFATAAVYKNSLNARKLVTLGISRLTWI